ncbi:hypothetical protein H696_01704 [Fonticula alba]|uniref:Methyltransferase type 11 domain-containing protein n=1 Tax=Fonticula alba TaxID=691883 RepID=A0A058ZEF6_FONAL|nr:hypothetical protein H696_01704 [Fonticula alba]KCV72308.1 hypothetical protein H696_01704 [Fonticula alba]|eukprot:XP_009493886.1 hypothetical protein H696_01704 [Fonticula alba]
MSLLNISASQGIFRWAIDILFAWLWTYLGVMADKSARHVKQVVFPLAKGKVLEVGPGFGPNFGYYNKDNITELHLIEPNKGMIGKLKANAAKAGFTNAKVTNSTIEAVPLENGQYDTIICCLVLCSVDSVQEVVNNLYRSLKPGGRLIFIEHVQASAGSYGNQFGPVVVAFWKFVQNMLTPFWRTFTGHCHVNRPSDQLLIHRFAWDQVYTSSLSAPAAEFEALSRRIMSDFPAEMSQLSSVPVAEPSQMPVFMRRLTPNVWGLLVKPYIR